MALHYPEIFGDPIPFYRDGVWHIFYLSPRQPDHEWRHISTRDFLNWETHPVAISPGTEPDAPDRDGCWTGSIFERDGVFHMFYTGYRQDWPDTQVVCHATSANLMTWTKDPANPILRSDGDMYDLSDWRDPFPMRVGDEYWMLITARLREGLELRRGAAALATSPDLKQWTLQPPYWSNGLSYSPECLDVFEWQGQQVMVWSAHVEDNRTHYRLADTLAGPWRVPPVDTFDGEHFYAAKTASDGDRRILFGWIPRRRDESDTGDWFWGGTFALPRELVPLTDGGIGVRCAPEITAVAREALPVQIQPRYGEWSVSGGGARGTAEHGFAFATIDDLPDAYLLRAQLSLTPGTRDAGFILHTTPDLQKGYQVHIQRGQLSYEPLPRKFWTPPAPVRPHNVHLTRRTEVLIFVEGTTVEVFVGGQVAFATRAYDPTGGSLGLFVQDGRARWHDLRIERL